jgi:2-methylisocitrate lyase-like PEP mutase family enzyme
MNTVKELLAKRKLIVCPGAYDALSARILEKVGYEIAYISGSALAAAAWALPDMGLLTLTEVLERARAIVRAVNIPVICDVDTGFGGINNARRMIVEFESIGINMVQMEDQVFPCRAGTIPGKAVIPTERFVEKLKAAVSARNSEDFLIIARTDCKETLGMDEVIHRLNIYADNGADLAMSGSFHTFEEYKRMAKEIKIPIVANCFPNQIDAHIDEWEGTGVKIVIYMWLPLFAVMKTTIRALQLLKTKGTVAEIKEELTTLEDRRDILKIDEWLNWAEKWT